MFLLLIVIAFASTLTLVSLSSVSRSVLGLRSSNPRDQRSARHNHRLAHLASFGILAFLISLLSRRPSHRIASLMVVVALGILIEISQHRIYDVPLETNDIKDDSYGAIAGTLSSAALMTIRKRKVYQTL